jgi:hypothetical protein
VYVFRCRIPQMPFAILRLQKLKSFADIGGSLSHNYRNRETLNADSDRTHLNEHDFDTNEKCIAAIRNRIPEKRRKDAVLCIEHLITASPEWDGWGTPKEADFFEQSKKWLEEKYGKKNIVSTTIHRDETTPHLVAYVVPVDEESGRLNAKKFIGGSRLTLSKMQTDFAQSVQSLGLKRGIEGSKAKHTSIREYYNDVKNYDPQPMVHLKAPEPGGMFETKQQYAERIIESVLEQLQSELKDLSLLATEARRAKEDALQTRKTLTKLEKRCDPYLSAIQSCSPQFIEFFNKQLPDMKNNFEAIFFEESKNNIQNTNFEEFLKVLSVGEQVAYDDLIGTIVDYFGDNAEKIESNVIELERNIMKTKGYLNPYLRQNYQINFDALDHYLNNYLENEEVQSRFEQENGNNRSNDFEM